MLPTKSKALDVLRTELARNGLGSVLENIPSLIVLLDAGGRLKGWNPAFEAFLQQAPETASMQQLLAPATLEAFEKNMRAVLETGTSARMGLEIGNPKPDSAYACVLMKQSNGHVLLIGAAQPNEPAAQADAGADTAHLDQLHAQLKETQLALEVKQKELQAVLAQTDEVVHTDALTLLPNRKWIIADLQQQVTYSERYGSPLSVSMIDLDYFKEVNDNFGHAAGDQVLRFMASEMRDRIRKPDVIGRYGGDEFLVILPNTPLAAAAEQAARLCQQVVSAPVRVGQDEIHVSLSIGIAQYKVNADDWRSLLERADQALYQAKHSGRGQWASLDG